MNPGRYRAAGVSTEPIWRPLAYKKMEAPDTQEETMRAPIFGLSTTPVADIKSELRLQIERDMLALVYRLPR